MHLKCIFIFFIEFLHTVFTNHVDHERKPPFPNLNVVLFFAQNVPCSNFKESGGIEAIQLQERARIKHAYNTLQKKRQNLMRFNRNDKTCHELLTSGLMSLLHYCKTVLGMNTAIAAVENCTFNENVHKTDKELLSEEQIPHEIAELPNSPTEEEDNHLNEEAFERQRDIIPYDHLKRSHQNGDLDRFFYGSQRFRPIKRSNKRKNFMGDIVTSQKHTDVFNIRTKRDGKHHHAIHQEIANIPLTKSKNIWSVFDIVTDTKLSFLGNIFGKEPTHVVDEDANVIDPSRLGEVKDNTLFEIVRKTLENVQENAEAGFLMIIIGGKLTDISNTQSALIQSIKHVIENTDSESTLIVLTGGCPPNHKHGKEIEVVEGQDKTIPLFARGPESEAFAECTEIYDVALTVKRILSHNKLNLDGNENEAGKHRQKRNLFGNVPPNKASSEGNTRKLLFESLIFLFVSILFAR